MTTHGERSTLPAPAAVARAFSLIELVIVIIIMGTITAIAIPRLTRNTGNAGVAAMWADVQAMNKAIDAYRFEHEVYPRAAHIARQLVEYSDKSGTKLSPTPDPAQGIVMGPYLREIPPMPIGPNEGHSAIGTSAGDGIGWIYLTSKVKIVPNLQDGSNQVPADVRDLVGEGAISDLNADLSGPASGP